MDNEGDRYTEISDIIDIIIVVDRKFFFAM